MRLLERIIAPGSLRRGRSEIAVPLDDGLDVDDRSTVNCLQTVHVEPALSVHTENLYAVQADGIRPVRRAGCKHAGQTVHVAARVHLENGALRFMQPGKNP